MTGGGWREPDRLSAPVELEPRHQGSSPWHPLGASQGRSLKEDTVSTFKTYYMDNALFDLANVIETAKERLADVEFDTLVGTGFSGGVVIPSLALAMGKKFVLIRKETDDSHHGKGRLLGELGARWIFVDDFTASGTTRKRVIEKIGATAQDYSITTTMVGQYMYCGWNEELNNYGRYSALQCERYSALQCEDW